MKKLCTKEQWSTVRHEKDDVALQAKPELGQELLFYTAAPSAPRGPTRHAFIEPDNGGVSPISRLAASGSKRRRVFWIR